MMNVITPLFAGLPGGPELIVILVVLVLLFGAQKIPKLARASGEAIGEFQKGREEIEDELDQMQSEEAEGENDTISSSDDLMDTQTQN